ncbi:hypothetical protein JVU11DRAFT_2734 [Chiua virens]|nr:hypothetical protein JVU11DRAFT_2734 [Chiua virens]
MSDSSSDSEHFSPENHHARLVSTASTASNVSGFSDAVDFNSPLYPRYSAHQPILDPLESPKAVGLMQPASALSHHGSNCSQIPKLRVACSAGLDGSRTMWSFCEQCWRDIHGRFRLKLRETLLTQPLASFFLYFFILLIVSLMLFSWTFPTRKLESARR